MITTPAIVEASWHAVILVSAECSLAQVETRDSRKLLRLIWCPAKHNASSVTAAPSRSHVLRQSIWERPRPSEESCPPEVSQLCLNPQA